MSLEQKVKLVTSLTLYESSPVGGYEFPVFKLKGQPYKECPALCVTRFPSDRALAASWNLPLIGEVYNAIGEESRRVDPYGYFNNTDDYTLENLSNDNFVTAKFILARTLGLAKSGKAVNLEKTPIGDGEHTYDKKFIADTVLADVKPTSILVKNIKDIENITKKFKYNNLFFGVASSAEETVRLFLEGCSLVFLSEDFIPELVNFLTVRTEKYRKDYKLFREGGIKLGEFDRRVRSLEIFDEQIIDEACDRLISLLLDMTDGAENAPELTGLDGKQTAKFDEISHDELALQAARECIVLVKNDGVLPLSHNTSLAVAGGYANDFTYHKELFGGNPTVQILPFEAINEYETLTVTGFAAGYKKGESGREDLIASAVELGAKSDCTLLYLCAGKGEQTLPPEQLELLNALCSKGCGIIAVVACDENIDLSFADKCRAILLTNNAGQEGTSAALDIICGIVSPSGKLTEEACNANGDVLYTFGHGLSYTKFEYRNLRVNTNGVSFTVANVGGYDGYAVSQLYVRKNDSDSFFSNKTLRGFAKTFVKQGDSVNVEIPFDENTFKSYSDFKKCYVIEGGDYEIFISENYDTDRLTGTVKLGGYVYKDIFENEVLETSEGGDIEFSGDKEKKAAIKSKTKLSFGVKLFIALMLGVYYNALIGVFAFTPIIVNKTMLVYIVLGVLAGVCDIALIIYIAVIAKNRKKQLALSENEVLTDMVEKIEEFKEIAKVTYADPVKDDGNIADGGEEEANGNAIADKKSEETARPALDISFDESEEEVTFTEHISLAEVCSNFREYALSFGVNIEITSVRAILSAMAASKIVVLKCANSEVMPSLLEALNSYFGSTAITEASPDWKDATDLMLKPSGDRFTLSDFTNAVYGAGKNPSKRCAAILTNVNPDNVLSYFGYFVDYANHPSETKELEIGDELTIKLPGNITYFLVPEESNQKPFPREILNASMCVELAISKADECGEVEVKNVAIAEFGDLIKEAREHFFLPEKIWKKVDELIATINASEKFEVGNKNTLQTEKLTSVIMDCGGDEGEAFTQMFICKLIPLIKTTRLYRQEGGERTLSGVIEKLFPEEEITKIQKALVKLN